VADYIAAGQPLASGAVLRRLVWGDQVSAHSEWAALAVGLYQIDPSTGLAVPVNANNPVRTLDAAATGSGVTIPYSGTAAGTASVTASQKIALISLFASIAGTATFQITGEAVVTVPASAGLAVGYSLSEAESKTVTFAGNVAAWAVGVFS